jgi:hypothetical protein
MAKKTSVTIPESAILLPDQIRMAIPAIERRITDFAWAIHAADAKSPIAI